MKKKMYLMSIIISLLLFPIKSLALENVVVSCNKTKLSKNEEITCQIKTGNLGYEISSFQGEIIIGDNLYLTSSTYDSGNWIYFGGDFSVKDVELATKNSYLLANNLPIATFTIKANSNAVGSSSLSLTNVNVADKNYVSKSLTGNSININFLSSINTLNSLNVSEHQINFNKDITKYSFTTNLDSITIFATPSDPTATVSGIGQVGLKYGLNEIKITVIAEDSTARDYILNVTRTDNRSSNNNLKKLSLSEGKINFSESKTTYNVEVDNKIESVNINAELADSKANFIQEFGPRKVDLKYGTNKVLIKVKSENNQEKVYTININRKDERNSNNYLKNIKLSKGKFKFNKDITEYNVSVPYETQKITINATAESKKSKIEIIGKKILSLGKNTFTIKVTAENEKIREYKIIVIREDKIEIAPSNKLKNIKIKGYKIDFNPNEYYYVVKTNKNHLNIKVTLQDNNSTYRISGNNKLKDGSLISIIVTDKDGNNNIYKIMIVEKSNTSLFIIITLSLMILSNSLTILIIKKKNNNDKQNNAKMVILNTDKYITNENHETNNQNIINKINNITDLNDNKKEEIYCSLCGSNNEQKTENN